METELADRQATGSVLSVEEVRNRVQVIQRCMKEIMIKGTHYGVIPGCGNKPTLLKPGAEQLLCMFRLAGEPQIEDLSDISGEYVKYRVTVRVTHIGSGRYLGSGVGECSSDEEKFR